VDVRDHRDDSRCLQSQDPALGQAVDFLESKLGACPAVSDERILAAIDLANACRKDSLPESTPGVSGESLYNAFRTITLRKQEA